MIKVILLIDCSSEFDRRLLRGIMKYSKENGSWLFYRMPSSLRWNKEQEKRILNWIKKWDANAVIGRWDDDKLNLLSRLDIPIVLQNYRSRSFTYSNLTGDYIGTGKMAARYFISKKFRNFAFYGIEDVVWSEERCNGFRNEVLEHKGNFHSLMVEPDKGQDSVRDQVSRWLEELPKPVALFACDDAHALFITETCKMAGIKIPDEISLLGVDNDELLCEISDPPISSIELDVENGGYQTCRLLHEMVNNSDNKPFCVTIKPKGIIQRRSSKKHDIADAYIERIVEYMENNYTSDVSIEEMLKLVPLSRRSLEIRFKKETGNTLYQFLTERRIEEFANLLVTTRKPLYEIAYSVGFKDGTNYSRIFKKHKGCSPNEYRNRHQ